MCKGKMNPKEIKKLRAALGLTQRELAERMGVTVTAVAHWEAGHRTPSGPAEKLLELLAENIKGSEKMSKKQVKKFFAKLEQDKELQDKFNTEMSDINQLDEDVLGPKLIDFGKSAGFEFDMDDLRAARQDLVDQFNENGELDDADLKNVAGGTDQSLHKGEAYFLSASTVGLGCAILSLCTQIDGTGCNRYFSNTKCNFDK